MNINRYQQEAVLCQDPILASLPNMIAPYGYSLEKLIKIKNIQNSSNETSFPELCYVFPFRASAIAFVILGIIGLISSGNMFYQKHADLQLAFAQQLDSSEYLFLITYYAIALAIMLGSIVACLSYRGVSKGIIIFTQSKEIELFKFNGKRVKIPLSSIDDINVFYQKPLLYDAKQQIKCRLQISFYNAHQQKTTIEIATSKKHADCMQLCLEHIINSLNAHHKTFS